MSLQGKLKFQQAELVKNLHHDIVIMYHGIETFKLKLRVTLYEVHMLCMHVIELILGITTCYRSINYIMQSNVSTACDPINYLFRSSVHVYGTALFASAGRK